MLLLCVIAASRGISALRETERQPTPTIALGPCIGASAYPDARCGNFEVYENRARQSGRKIALNVAVIPAISKTRAAAPIFLIAGGPGFGVAGEIQGKSRWIDSLRAKNDVVLVDQRGTGASHPLACPGLLAGYKLQDFFDEAGTAFARNLQTCHEQLAQNADVTQYTTPIAMDDLDDVRISLGYDRVILFGMSYGTRAAMVYLHQHPMQVESLILASVDPPASKIPLHVARGTEHALDRLFTDCSADDGCRAAFPNVREELNAVLSRLEKSPATVQASLSSSSGPETMHLTKAMFAVRLELLLTGPDSASRVPYLIHQAAQGDFSEFVKRITQTISSTDSGTGFARGMYMTVMCSEDVPSISDDEMARESSGTMIGTALVEQWRRTCKSWPRGTVPPSYHESVASSVPAVLFSGELDPITPPWLAAEVARSLSNSRNIVARNGVHPGFPINCMAPIIATFIQSGSSKNVDGSCADSVRRPAFMTRNEP